MIKKILWLMFVVEILNANNITALEQKIFPKNDQIVNTGSCNLQSWQCRDVNSGYVTEIIGINFELGVTYCKVYRETDMEKDLGINANRANDACIPKEETITAAKTFLKSQNYNQSKESNITYVKNEQNLNLTKFITSLVVLNPSILDREKMKQTGKIELQNGKNFHSTQTLTDKGLLGKDVVKGEAEWGDIFKTISNNYFYTDFEIDKRTYNSTTAIDGFNQNNMAYFSDLFLANEKIYQHLQILIFVLIGGFFVMQIGAKKFQAYLENRGENNAKEPYLHKFYIPIIMLGIFFMPIPEANGLAHSTIIQNIIRTFTTHSNDLADMAHSIGAKTYMDKIYKQIGIVDPNQILNMAKRLDENRHIKNHSTNIYKQICEPRYEELSNMNIQSFNFQTMTEEEKTKLREDRKFDLQQKSNTKENISKEACIQVLTRMYQSENEYKILEHQFLKIRKNIMGEAGQKLHSLDAYFTKRNEQLGWIEAILLPSSVMLAEIVMFADDSIVEYSMEKNTKTNIRNNQIAIEQGDVEAANKEISDSAWGYLTGTLVWMMLPGGSAVKDFIQSNSGKIGAALGSVIGGIGGGIIGGIGGSLAGTALAYSLTPIIMEYVYSHIPLLVCTTASLIAFMSYLVTLCKYFYVSPFVVAFSFATRDFSKIINFLIAGISVFFKPVLIVIFIYLALFLHTLIQELLIFLATSQFAGIKLAFDDFYQGFTPTAITALLKIFGYLASSYIMWKLIVGGPSWTLGLVGIDGKQDDMIASGLEQKLQNRAFVA